MRGKRGTVLAATAPGNAGR